MHKQAAVNKRCCMKMVSLSSVFRISMVLLMCSMIHMIDTVQYDSYMINVKVITKPTESEISSKLQLTSDLRLKLQMMS